jgi:hypothetical protein
MAASAPPPTTSLRTVGALILVIAGLATQWRYGNRSVGIDFYQFWLGGQAVREGQAANLYSDAGRQALAADGQRRATLPDAGLRLQLAARVRSRVETFSTPLLYSAFALLGRGYETSFQAYRALSLLAVSISILLLGRSARLRVSWSLFLLAFVLFFYEPLASEVRVANVNAMQLLMLAAGIALLSMPGAPRIDVAAGALFAIAAAFKPNLLVIVPLLVISHWRTRDRGAAIRFASGALLGGGFAVGLTTLLFGTGRCWLQWRTAATQLAATILPRSAGNVAPLLPLVERYGPIVSAAAAALLIAVTIVAVARGGRGGAENYARRSQLVAGVGVLIYLMTAGLVWLHYILLALPSAVALLGRRHLGDSREPGDARQDAAIRITTLLALSASAIDPWAFVMRLSRSAVAPVAVTLGLATLFILSVAELARRRVDI